MILYLLLAQVLTGSAFTQPTRHGHVTDFTIEMPSRDPLLDYSQGIIESKAIGKAVQTGQVYDPFSGRTMIRTTAPSSPYYNMSREQASQIREEETKQLANEVNIRSAEFKQKADAMDYKYKLSEIDQSEKYLSRVPELDPNHPDYPIHKAKLDREFPIGALNPEVQRKLGLLDQTYTGITQNERLLNRQKQLQDEADMNRQVSQGREMAAKFGGTAGVAQYEELLAKDQKNPIGALAAFTDAQEKQSRLSQLTELLTSPDGKVDTNRMAKFYTPTVGPDGKATPVLDTRRVDSFIKTFPTASQASQASAAREKMRANHLGETPDKWDPADQAEYNFHGQQLQRYQALIGQPQEEKKAPAIKSIDDFF